MELHNLKKGDISKIAFATKSSQRYVKLIIDGDRNVNSEKSKKILKAVKILSKANKSLDDL